MKKTLLLITVLLFAFSVAFASDAEKADKADAKADAKEEKMEKKEKKIADLDMQTTKSGVKYFDIIKGAGHPAKYGTKVEVHYTLWFADSTGEKGVRFQSSKDPNPRTQKIQTFICTIGQRLIQGWSDGMVGMEETGIRLLVIPPHLGYGQGGRGIPPNATLIFEIEYLRHISDS